MDIGWQIHAYRHTHVQAGLHMQVRTHPATHIPATHMHMHLHVHTHKHLYTFDTCIDLSRNVFICIHVVYLSACALCTVYVHTIDVLNKDCRRSISAILTWVLENVKISVRPLNSIGN